MAEPEIKVRLNQGRQQELLDYDQVSLSYVQAASLQLIRFASHSSRSNDKPGGLFPCLMKAQSIFHQLTSTMPEQTNTTQGNIAIFKNVSLFY